MNSQKPLQAGSPSIEGLKPVVALMTATKDERTAIYRLLERKDFIAESKILLRGDRPLVELNECYLVVYSQQDKGTLSAAEATADLIAQYRPVLVALVGVCGESVEQPRQELGHVFVGTQSIYYEPCKEELGESAQGHPEIQPKWNRRLLPSGDNRGMSEAQKQVRELIEELVTPSGEGILPQQIMSDAKNPILTEPDDMAKLRELLGKLKVRKNALFTCGERFMCSLGMSDMLKELTQEHPKQKTWAFDMESAGVASACESSQTSYLFIKASSDDGRKDEDNEYHQPGTILAAALAIRWIASLSETQLCELHQRYWQFDPETSSDSPNEGYRKSLTEIAALASAMLPPPALTLANRAVRQRTQDHYRTFYDRVIDTFLRDACKSLPGVNLYAGDSENGVEALNSAIRGDELIAIADAVDGTQNLADGRPEVAVSIAIYKGGNPVSGVIAIPYIDLVVGADFSSPRMRRNGIGTLFVNGLEWRPVDAEERFAGVNVADCVDYEHLSKAIVSLPGDYLRLRSETNPASKYFKTLETLVCSLPWKAAGVRASGALAYDLVWLALGRLDARVSTSSTAADIAAARILVEEAGGCLYDLEGKPWGLMSNSLVASSTEGIAKDITALVDSLKDA